MTLILSIQSRESIWLLSDRRLSYRSRKPRDDGRKVMFLETTDGVAILGYAGLGATGAGTEPSDWMSAALRGRNLPFEQSLAELAGAAQRQLPRHLGTFPRDAYAAHHIVIPAFVDDRIRLYSIDLALAPDRRTQAFRYTRHVVDAASQHTPRLTLAGSGASYLARNEQSWFPHLLRLVRASDAKRVSPLVVADYLAEVNLLVHKNTPGDSVGPRSIVAWRYRKQGVHRGGGGHQFYDGTRREANNGALPNIGNGMDIAALVRITMPQLQPQMEAMMSGAPFELDTDKLNAELAKLPKHPDEKLR